MRLHLHRCRPTAVAHTNQQLLLARPCISILDQSHHKVPSSLALPTRRSAVLSDLGVLKVQTASVCAVSLPVSLRLQMYTAHSRTVLLDCSQTL